jgi:hypothetical protein
VPCKCPGRWRRRDRTESERRAANDLWSNRALAYVFTERPQGAAIPALALHFHTEFDQGIGGSAVERAVRELEALRATKLSEVRALRETAEKEAQKASERLSRVKGRLPHGELTAAEWRELRAELEPERRAAEAEVE